MIELKGKYNKDCKIFTDDVESQAISLIQSILDHPVSDNRPVRIMPDTHLGKGIVIGFTMPINESYINPNHIGVDIGCGVTTVKVRPKVLDLLTKGLHDANTRIRNVIPVGFSKRTSVITGVADELDIVTRQLLGVQFDNLCNLVGTNIQEVLYSVGTLGGGNHFIELGIDEQDEYWLTIHSGSRNFGKRVCDYYASKSENKDGYINGDIAYEYLNCMRVAQIYASINRTAIVREICRILHLAIVDEVSSIHNYIDFNYKIIRKGAISAMKDERVVIPFNMKDGLIIGVGKGNIDWNMSAPHGAGRVLSRSKAKEVLKMEDFERMMGGIYSTSINQSTLDEAPGAYKDSELIKMLIEPTVEIVNIVKPILNIKA